MAPNVSQGTQGRAEDSEQNLDSELNNDELEDQQDIAVEENPTISQGKVPMKGNKILYQLPGAEDWFAGTVIVELVKPQARINGG